MIIFSIAGVGLLTGMILGSYCQLCQAIKSVLFSWELLISYAIDKRRALLHVAPKDLKISLEQELCLLTEAQHLSWKQFLANGYDLLLAVQEMEAVLPNKLGRILAHADVGSLPQLEEFWARDNLFAFEATACEQAINTYLLKRSKPLLRLTTWLFRFRDLPKVRFNH